MPDDKILLLKEHNPASYVQVTSVPGPPSYGGILYFQNGELKVITSGGQRRTMRSGREDLMASGQGLIAQNYDRQAAGNTSIMIGGTIYFGLLPLFKDEVVTNVHISVTANGVTSTLAKCGLYDKAGNRLAISADQGTAWDTAGIKTVPMSTPYTILADDVYFAAVIAQAATLPTLARNANNGNIPGTIGSGARPFGTQAGQTDLINPATIGAASSIGYWFGVS